MAKIKGPKETNYYPDCGVKKQLTNSKKLKYAHGGSFRDSGLLWAYSFFNISLIMHIYQGRDTQFLVYFRKIQTNAFSFNKHTN